MDAPLVSVIIPNYNHAPFLLERIESVLGQTYEPIEIIFLDDCSSDNSREVIERYRSNAKISAIVFNEQNSGTTFKQWKKGIELARGEWIWIAESDDWCEPTLLATLMAGANDNRVIAFCQTLMVQEGGRVLWKTNSALFENELAGGEFITQQMLVGNGIPNASMCVFRKECYFKLTNEFLDYKFCGDWLFWILIARQGNVFISGKYLNYFRKHGKDVSGKATLNGLIYSEYIKLLVTLTSKEIITLEESRGLAIVRLKELLNDTAVLSEAKEKLTHDYLRNVGHRLFSASAYAKLGKRVYLKALLKKYL